MASKRAYLDHLRNVPLFNSCSNKELQTIARATDELTVPAGHVLTDQGQMGREAFVIVDGSATVKRNGKKVATLGPGSVVGELSLLDHGPRTATVTTDSDTTVLVIEQRHFLGGAGRRPVAGPQAPRHAGGAGPRVRPPVLRLARGRRGRRPDARLPGGRRQGGRGRRHGLASRPP